MGFSSRAGGALRLLTSLVLLLLLASRLDLGAIARRLTDLRAGWVTAALVLSVGQMFVLGWRWSFTARRMGIALPLRAAISEYYLSLFLNQVLPGGVTGDVSRAWRHARASGARGAAVSAVVLERMSAQIVMTGVAGVSVLAVPRAPVPLRLAGLAVVIAIALALVWAAGRRSAEARAVEGMRRRVHDAFQSPSALTFQLGTSIAVVASYIGMYLIAAHAVGIGTSTVELLPLVAPVLMTMLVPVTVAGWGIREGAAAGLWSVAGLTPEDGVAISVAYGLLVLVSSGPGALVLMRASLADRGRRERPAP